VRLFVAIDVPDAIKEAIEDEVVAGLRPSVAGARWTRPEGRHLTLKFLGNVDDERVGDIAGCVRQAAALRRRFDASFDEIGGFPDLRRPRVLWIGIGEGAEAMSALARDLDRVLEPLGFEPEARPFHGHFTLARFPKPQLIGELREVSVPVDSFAVDEVILFRSQLHPKGARYTALERFRLSS
jgi:2'-5' RNA ligase